MPRVYRIALREHKTLIFTSLCASVMASYFVLVSLQHIIGTFLEAITMVVCDQIFLFSLTLNIGVLLLKHLYNMLTGTTNMSFAAQMHVLTMDDFPTNTVPAVGAVSSQTDDPSSEDDVQGPPPVNVKARR